MFLLSEILGVCPVLCSQRGEYINGECQCNPGWKGKECNLRHDECEVPDCNGHGYCTNGKCICALGFKGKYCTEGNVLLLLFFFNNFNAIIMTSGGVQRYDFVKLQVSISHITIKRICCGIISELLLL